MFDFKYLLLHRQILITTNILSETFSLGDLPDDGVSLDKHKIISLTPESCIEVIPIGEELVDLSHNSKSSDFYRACKAKLY